MKKTHRIGNEVKDQILNRIKTEGVSVAKAAEDHGISTQTIYSWLTKGVKAPVSMLEHARLKRENQSLKEMLGEVTMELKRSQKNN
jgi:transposase-like protein